MLKKLIFSFFFLTISASCPNGSLEWQDECYFFQNDTSEFMTAEISCVQIGGHLVSIHDAMANALLAQEGGSNFHQSTVTDFWIGLTNMMPGGNWSWMDGTPLDFSDWAISEPKNVSGSSCTALSVTDGFWRSENCYQTKPYVCKVDKSFYEPSATTTKATTTSGYPVFGYCPYPYIYFQPTHSCYGNGNMTGPMDWTTAERYCVEQGGHLPSVHSFEEAMFLGYNVYAANSDFWTGAFSIDGGLTWKWSDGSRWDYNPWAQGYPYAKGNACGVMWGGAIANFPCNEIHRPICKKNL